MTARAHAGDCRRPKSKCRDGAAYASFVALVVKQKEVDGRHERGHDDVDQIAWNRVADREKALGAIR
jgi:hypothetical protein